MKYNSINVSHWRSIMPISLRLPPELEAQLAGLSARQQVSKSALIVRSIKAFLMQHTTPSSQEIYAQAMRGSSSADGSNERPAEQRLHKLAVREAVLRKATQRRGLKRKAG
jgi:predicted transcriptional regulator